MKAKGWIVAVVFVFLVLDPQLGSCHLAQLHAKARLQTAEQQDGANNNNNNTPNTDNNNNNKTTTSNTTDPDAKRMEEHIKIVWTGSRFVVSFLILINLLVLYAVVVFGYLHRHMPDKYQSQSKCEGKFECIGVPIATLLLHICATVYYAIVLYPTKEYDNSGNRFRYVTYYRILGITGLIFLILEHWFAVYWLVFRRADRPAGMILSVLLPCLMLFLLVLQACVAAMSGEWYPYLKGVDGTISSSMDYLTGQITAVCGLALLAGLFPFAEVQQKYTKNTWLHGLRILLVMSGGVGMFLVALSPISNSDSVGTVGQTQQDQWQGQHFVVAAVAFGSLFAFYVAATVDHAKNAERRPGFMTYFGFAIATLGFLMLAVTVILKFTNKTDLSELLFASAEYILMVAAPFVTGMRFSKIDFEANRKAMMNIYDGKTS